ncbi:MAG: alkaline phosphatase [bacterium]
MQKMKSTFTAILFNGFLIAVFLISGGCTKHIKVNTASSNVSSVKNIILLIGDGMGLPQINLARIKVHGAGGSLNIDKMPVVGLLKTHAADKLITDSAAAATALACGVKTRNGVISRTPDGKNAMTILEAARDKGLSTGLVATSTITHATPAVFAAHVESRRQHAEIAVQMIAAKVNILLGGGKAYFLPKSNPASKRTDDRNLLAEAQANGYKFVEIREQLGSAQSKYLLGLFQNNALTTHPPEPSLAEMTHKALNLLNRNPKGFFLMVEGSQIDWRSHDQNAEGSVEQMLLFDEAIKVARKFAEKNQNTLVLITADHETGGLTLTGGSLDGEELQTSWSTGGHTAVDVPIFAFGPHAEWFTGVYENTEVAKKMAALLNVQPLPKLN